MPRTTSTGRCALCGAEVSKPFMTRHVQACPRDHSPSAKHKPGRAVLLFVEGRALPEYWLLLEVRCDASLRDLDGFLRSIWLECCGHASAFTIDGAEYTRDPGHVDGTGTLARSTPPTRSMTARVAEVLQAGVRFRHEYDFGTTTELAGHVVRDAEDPFPGRAMVTLLARNVTPAIPCVVCGNAATTVCVDCDADGQGCLCASHAGRHECGEEMLLPVVNSPRAGQCGYTGPVDPNAYFNA